MHIMWTDLFVGVWKKKDALKTRSKLQSHETGSGCPRLDQYCFKRRVCRKIAQEHWELRGKKTNYRALQRTNVYCTTNWLFQAAERSLDLKTNQIQTTDILKYQYNKYNISYHSTTECTVLIAQRHWQLQNLY